MRVYAICSDGSPVEIARLDSLETVTISPEMEESLPYDGLRNLCLGIDFSINSEIDCEALRRAFEKADAIMEAARIIALTAAISVDEALYALERLASVSATTGSALSQLRYSSAYDDVSEEDYISELRAESMEPHQVIVIFPAPETLHGRTLRELYGQGVDAGPWPSRPGLIRPADDGPGRAETGGGNAWMT